jgi:hypothetical protein
VAVLQLLAPVDEALLGRRIAAAGKSRVPPLQLVPSAAVEEATLRMLQPGPAKADAWCVKKIRVLGLRFSSSVCEDLSQVDRIFWVCFRQGCVHVEVTQHAIFANLFQIRLHTDLA